MANLLDNSVVFSFLLLLTNELVSSQQSVYYFFYQRPAYPRDCKEVLDSCHYQRSSGVYVIKPDGYQKPFEVYCDNTVDSGGWTIILRRHDGSVTFHRDWLDYKLGFGFLSQELWIGHEKLSFLTNQKMYELRIDVTNSDGTSSYALYTFFRTSDDFSNYRLTGLGLYNGTLDNGQNCVHQGECDCDVDGVRIQEGQTHMFPNCLKSCSCLNSQGSCDNSYQCTINEICQLQNNMYQCFCKPGYVRVGDTCVFICSSNEEYGSCTCERSCGNPQVCMSCTSGQRCYCPTGFYLNGEDCVPQEQCGCLVDGVFIPEGQSHMFPNCLKSCSCSNSQGSCDNTYQCTMNEICQLQNNMYQCFCKPGFVRVGDICVSICSSNEEYGSCSCEASCGNPQVCIPCTPGQRCYCPTGFYLNGEDCVPQEQCGCLVDGVFIPEGQTHMFPNCFKSCSCSNSQESCDNTYQCTTNEFCQLQNNMYQCSCNPGYVRVGETCVSICSSNEVYGTCTCEASCGNSQDCITCAPGQQCYCPNGFYLNGEDCVPQEQCRCLVDGVYIPEGQTHMFPNCLKSCSCSNSQGSCDNSYQCTTNEFCQLQNNMYQCSCNPGYVRVGDTCVSICSSNEVYGTCTCEASCGNPQDCIVCAPGQRCYCPNGRYLQGSDCILKEQCGCYNSFDDSILQNGESYVNSDCSQECTCNNDQLSCTNYECSPNAECRVQDGEGQCHCNEGYSGDGETCTTLTYTDCYDVYQAGERRDGFYSIFPSGWTGSSFNVPCNMTIDGGGWTVLQRRVDGTESFERNWDGYKTGFGVPGPEFWLGNDKMHVITNQRNYELRMDVINLDGDAYFAKYSLFRIGDESSNYQLVDLGVYDAASTTGYDAMAHHRNQFFSTPDNDNDPFSYNCAEYRRGGWWYGDDIYNVYCDWCDFNRPNIGTTTYPYPYWYYLPGSNYLMYTDIKIRPV